MQPAIRTIEWPATVLLTNSELINGVFQTLTRLKLWLLGRGNLDCFASPRVTPNGRRAVRHTKRAKTYEANIATRFKFISNAFKYRIDSFCRISLRKISIAGNFSYKIVFIHFGDPPSVSGKRFAGRELHPKTEQIL
tara:strand:- start:6916 stop:7326 length:411 start_codon:yes stop_codon:yes gene_type:complete